MEEFEAVLKYKKKSKKVHHKKSDHTHRYNFCVYEYDFPRSEEAHGIVPVREQSIGTYCPICGKVYARFTRDSTYVQRSEKFKNHFYLGYEWNQEALKEFSPETRTLPCFFLEDYSSTKYVELENK